MQRRPTTPGAALAPLLTAARAAGCAHDAMYVDIVSDNALADGFDFPVEPGEMDGWREPPEADEAWDASSYLVHRADGIHAAIDFMRDDDSSAAGYELWAIADGVVVDLVYDRETYPDQSDGRDEGWGNIILIQHDYREDDTDMKVWSMYAHCQTIEVELGQVVSRNQRVGLVGHSDGVSGSDSWSDHLHFELRITNLSADAWPQDMGLTTDEEVEEYYTHPLEFIRAHRPAD